ncbi:hypothetical protein JCGZ_02892 [Jatropha curcas]|uniref:Uncharacterized protein n=1 Tax=Jatropha curcas TaxID=180498 RepID=A0A067L164_JATCU|nr:hypothetical protein JCGZ_02892 [Jatropha curcas]
MVIGRPLEGKPPDLVASELEEEEESSMAIALPFPDRMWGTRVHSIVKSKGTSKEKAR